MKHHVIPILLGLFMLAGGLTHLLHPDAFNAMIPDIFPERLINYAVGVIEISIAALLIIPRFRHYGGLFFAVLCVAFMPFHLWDLWRPDPVIKPMAAAIFRIILQLAFIFAGYRIFKRYSLETLTKG